MNYQGIASGIPSSFYLSSSIPFSNRSTNDTPLFIPASFVLPISERLIVFSRLTKYPSCRFHLETVSMLGPPDPGAGEVP